MAAAAVVASCTRLRGARRSRDRSVRLKAAERNGTTDRLSDSDSDDDYQDACEEKDTADGDEEGLSQAAGGRKAVRPKAISDYSLTIELLLIAGADLNRLNGCGETALAIAERCGHEVGAEVLRKAKLKGLKIFQSRKLKTGLGDLPGRKNRAMAFGADMTKEDEVAKATFEAEAAAAKLLASEEAAVEQTETKSKRQKQKAKQKKMQDKKSGTSLPLAGQLDHDAILEEAAAVVAQFAVVDGLQACSPEVEFVDEDEDGRAAERSESSDEPKFIAAPVVAPFPEVNQQQACLPQVEFVDEDEDWREAERSDSIAAPVASEQHGAFTSHHASTTDEEPSARELTLICENSDLRSQLDEYGFCHAAERRAEPSVCTGRFQDDLERHHFRG